MKIYLRPRESPFVSEIENLILKCGAEITNMPAEADTLLVVAPCKYWAEEVEELDRAITDYRVGAGERDSEQMGLVLFRNDGTLIPDMMHLLQDNPFIEIKQYDNRDHALRLALDFLGLDGSLEGYY